MPTDCQLRTKPRITLETWAALRADFVAGKGTVRQLAAAHGVSGESALDRCCKEHWVAARASVYHSKAPPTVSQAQINIPAPPAVTDAQRKVQRLEKQLSRIDDMIDRCSDARDMLNLSGARERLFAAWCTLTQHPRPPVARISKRGSQAPSAPASSDVAPPAVQVTPAPLPIPPAPPSPPDPEPSK